MKHYFLISIAGAIFALSGAAAEPAKNLYGAARAPAASMPPAPIGEYAKGCLAGARMLHADGPGWQAMRPARNRSWGHPEMIAFIERLAASARLIGWDGILVGDISQPRGGPMTSGHASHQIGLDADIWMRPAPATAFTARERNETGSFSVVRGDRRELNDDWTQGHAALLRAAARDGAVARIFVNAAIKQRLCRDTPSGDRAWLAKIRPWWGHDHHFHVRLACPAGAAGCVDQAPPGGGDGCGDELAWWFTDEALNPKPATTPKRDLTPADLPAACAGVLNAP